MLSPNPTAQEVFDFAVSKVIEQGEPSRGAGGSCRYRTRNQDNKILKCAVGHLIPDENYYVDLENLTAVTGLVQKALPEGVRRYKHLLHNLQLAHDNANPLTPADFVEDFKERAKGVASFNNLEWRF